MRNNNWSKKLSTYYQNDLKHFYGLVSGSNNLKRKIIFKKDTLDSQENLKNKNIKYDYVILSDALGNVYDIQNSLRKIKQYCHNDTRLVLNWHSFVWQPFLNLAEYLGFKTPQPRANWLNKDDIMNLLTLEGFETIKSGKRFLFPLPLGKVSQLINKYLANFPIINNFCLTNYAVARTIEMNITNSYSVSIIVPARNEEGNIENVVKNFSKLRVKKEIIFVEGNSNDNTWKQIQILKLKYRKVRILAAKQPGIGKADAVRKGFSLATNDILMIWDADLTVSPTDFYKFYEAISSRKGEFVFGSRLVYPLEKDSMRLLNIIGNKFFSWIFSWLLGQPIKDTLCGTKAISRKNYLKLAKNRKYFGDFDPFGDFDLIFGAAKLNLKFAEIPIRYQARTYGQTNISRFQHGWLLLKMVFYAMGKLKFV